MKQSINIDLEPLIVALVSAGYFLSTLLKYSKGRQPAVHWVLKEKNSSKGKEIFLDKKYEGFFCREFFLSFSVKKGLQYFELWNQNWLSFFLGQALR